MEWEMSIKTLPTVQVISELTTGILQSSLQKAEIAAEKKFPD